MKYIFVICLLMICSNHFGQKLALLDRYLKQPITFTDSLTEDHIRKGLIPVELNDLDTFYANLNYIEAMVSNLEKTNLSSFELRSGTSYMVVTRLVRGSDERGNNERYNISLNACINEVNSRYILANGNKTNREIKYDVKDLKNYLNSISKFFQANYEIYPKLYNVLVYPN